MFERDNRVNDAIMLDNLYNMIKTSLSLNNNSNNKRELLLNFEKVAKDIDKREHNIYLEEVNEKFYKTTNLDDERKRLSGLIVLITERMQQRNNLLEDYYKVTGCQLPGLDEINYANELNSYKDRANVICAYLENEEEIINIKKELEFLSTQLEKERDVKRNCEVVNAKLEEKLLSNFKNVIAGNKYYTSLSFKDIDDEIRINEKDLKEKEEKVNAFVLAYESIKNESITSNEQLEEYSSYVIQMKELYYDCTKKNAFLQIYKLVMKQVVSTEEIFQKRLLIKKILDDLTTIKLKLKIDEPNLLFDFYMLVKEQDVKVTNSVDNMKKIKQIEDKIDYFNEKIVRLKKMQENERIISILKEYGLIKDEIYDTPTIEQNIYDIPIIEQPANENVYQNNVEIPDFDLPDINEFEDKSEKDEDIKYLENAIKGVLDISSVLDIVKVTKKAYEVIKKVSSRLGINTIGTEKANTATNSNVVTQKEINQEINNSSNITLPDASMENHNQETIVPNIVENIEENSVLEKTEENNVNEQPVVMPNFDFTTFWDEINVNNNVENSNDGNNMPNLPI